MNQYLFSYGTLQYEKVQIESFGRRLKGVKDVLKGYRQEQLKITDTDVLSKSRQKNHPIIIASANESDSIEGVLFEISENELIEADLYEVSDYKRVKEKFESGKEGWVYIKA